MDTLFTKAHFSDLKYPVLEVPDDILIVDYFKELQNYNEFKIIFSYNNVNITNIVHKYAFLMYQPSIISSLQLSKRKNICASLSGFFKFLKKGKYPEQIENIILLYDKDMAHLVLRICKLVNKQYYTDLVCFEEAVNKQRLELLKTDNPSNINKILNNINTLTTEIERLTNIISNNDSNINLREALYEDINNEYLGIEPEVVVKAIYDGDVDNYIKKIYNG